MNLTWSRPTPPQLGLALAGESGHLFTWADPPHLTLWHQGEIVQKRQAAQSLLTGAISDSGTSLALVSTTGRLWGLGIDLRTHWELQLPAPALALALDPLGDLLAVSDAQHGLHLLQANNGRALWRVNTARPLRYLRFVPEQPLLVGAADTALVAAFDPAGTCRWRTALAAHIGGLIVQGNGKRILVAALGEGPICFDNTGQRLRDLSKLGPCRRLACSYDGRLFVVETLQGELLLSTGSGARLGTHRPTGRLLDFALSPLGDRLILGLVEGELQEYSLHEPQRRDEG